MSLPNYSVDCGYQGQSERLVVERKGESLTRMQLFSRTEAKAVISFASPHWSPDHNSSPTLTVPDPVPTGTRAISPAMGAHRFFQRRTEGSLDQTVQT